MGRADEDVMEALHLFYCRACANDLRLLLDETDISIPVTLGVVPLIIIEIASQVENESIDAMDHPPKGREDPKEKQWMDEGEARAASTRYAS
ncbi:hypothetical protein ACLOJK_024720 [Asimina triloba]